LRTIIPTTRSNEPNEAGPPDASDRADPQAPLSPFWWFVLSLGGLVAFLCVTAGATEGSPREIAIFAVVISLAGLLCVRQVYPTRESSASFLFVVCFSLFNLGLAPFVAFGITIPTFGLSVYDTSWLYTTAFPRAMTLATLGLLALLVGTTFGRLFGTGAFRPPDSPEARSTRDAVSAYLGLPGAALMAVAVIAFFAVALSHGGFRIFTSGYPNWLAATKGSPLPYVYALTGFGTGILAISTKSRARTMGAIFFVAFALPALVVGLRAEVLFPIVSAVVMGAFRTPLLNGKRFFAVLIVVLLVVSGIRTFREVGFADATATSASSGPSFNAFDGLAEMGYSLRPTVVVLQWQEEGQPSLDGGSFESPFVRLAHSALPVLGPNTPALTDPDILNTVVAQRVGAIGFSQTAEAYDNWGTAGVIGFLLAIGLALSWIDRSPLKASSLLIRNSVFVPLLLEVRNTFTPVPAQVLLGLVASFVVLAYARHRLARSSHVRSAQPFQLASRSGS
jgi:hypothetical protein